jgi:hypothetical protein
MKINVFKPFARPSASTPIYTPIVKPNISNPDNFVAFLNKMPNVYNKLALKNHIPRYDSCSISTSLNLPTLKM